MSNYYLNTKLTSNSDLHITRINWFLYNLQLSRCSGFWINYISFDSRHKQKVTEILILLYFVIQENLDKYV